LFEITHRKKVPSKLERSRRDLRWRGET